MFLETLDPNALMLAIVVITAIVFLIRVWLVPTARSIADEIEEFLWASRDITKQEVRLSTAATYSAFATVIFWFLALGYDYGFWLFFVPMALIVGNVIFIRFLRHIDFDFSKYRTIGDLVYTVSKSRLLGITSDAIVVVFLWSALLVEIVIGSGIINLLVGGVPGGQLTVLLILSILVLTYVLLGGFRAIIRTDRLQISATVLGTLAILLFALAYNPMGDNSAPQLEYVFLPSDRYNAWAILALLVSAISVHIFGPVCQLTNWQRIKSAGSQRDGIEGHMQGIVITATLWVLIIIVALLLRSSFETTNPLNDVLSLMREGDIVARYFLYPLAGAGLVLALVSTADSAMGALFLSAYDIAKRARPDFQPKMVHKLLVGFVVFAAIVTFYLLNQTALEKNVITIVYFLFAQLVVLFPLIVFVLTDGAENFMVTGTDGRGYQPRTVRRLFTGTIFGWLIVSLLTIIGNRTGLVELIFIASGCGVFGSAIVIVGSKWPQVIKFVAHARLLNWKM